MVLLYDIFSRFWNFRDHYTYEGVLPLRDFLVQPDLSHRLWSLFYLSDSPALVGLLFALFFLAALAFTLGFRARLFGWICWVMLVSLQRRNPIVTNAGDLYLCLLLLWGNFLPWADCFALDQRSESEPVEYRYSALPGFCYVLQVSIVYWFVVGSRTGSEWTVDGTAIYYVLSMEEMRTGFAPYFLALGPGLLKLLTFSTLLFEIFGPCLLFLPFQWTRILGVLVILSFHSGIFFCVALGTFILVCLVGPIGLLPPLVWESSMGRKLTARLDRIFLYLSSKMVGQLGRGESKARQPWLPERVYSFIPMVLMLISLGFMITFQPQKRTVLTGLARVLAVDQGWNVYSPRPPDRSAWQSVQARTESGAVVDLMTGQAYTNDVHEMSVKHTYLNYRWTTYCIKLNSMGAGQAYLYLRYLARKWDQSHPNDKITSAQYLVHEHTNPLDYALGEDRAFVKAYYQP